MHLRRPWLAVTGALLLWLACTDLIAESHAGAEASATVAQASGEGRLDQTRALAAIEECLACSSATDGGSIERERTCPGLAAAMDGLGLDRQLPHGWQSHLDRSTLVELLALIRRYRADAPSSPPALAQLREALHSLNAPAGRHLSWWERFERWLDGLLTPQAGADRGWLLQLLSHLAIPRWLQQAVLYLSVGALLAMAGYIIWLELRAAGVLARERPARTPPPPRGESAPEAGARELDFEDLQRVPPLERCVWLMRLLVQALRRSGRLQREAALTYRELTAQPVFDDPQQRASFERLALLAERQRYGTLSLDGEQWLQLLEEARALHAAWHPSGAARAAGAASGTAA